MSSNWKWFCTIRFNPSIRIFVNKNKNKLKLKEMWKNRYIVDEIIIGCPAEFRKYFLTCCIYELDLLKLFQLYDVLDNMSCSCSKCGNVKKVKKKNKRSKKLDGIPLFD
jgi:hypothetical protein